MKRSVEEYSPQSISARLDGTELTVYQEQCLNRKIQSCIELNTEQKLLCAHHNMHSLALRANQDDLRKYHELAEVHWIDGMPLILMLRLRGYPLNRSWRITFLDWQHSFYRMCEEQNYRVFLLGSTTDNIALAAARITAEWPNLNLAFNHGYLFSAESENKLALAKIKEFNPDILLVGMGMPLQEKWILNNHQECDARVILPIGGYFDYLAGATVTPPRWTGKFGLEGLVRLISSPRRLGHRYLIEPWPVLYRFVKDWMRGR